MESYRCTITKGSNPINCQRGTTMKNLIKLVVFVLAVSVLVGIAPPKRQELNAATIDGFSDVWNSKEFWFKPVYWASENGITTGYKDGTFKPGNDCTRAQMVTFLWRMKGSPAPKTTSCSFKDVKKSAYYYNSVLWAVEKGITTGYSKTKFKPNNVCTRAQTVTFLWRMAGKPAPKAKSSKFSDVKKGAYYYDAVLWASEKGIVAGYKNGTFKPNEKCLRRQIVTFLWKYSGKPEPRNLPPEIPEVKVTNQYKKTKTFKIVDLGYSSTYTCKLPKVTISGKNTDVANDQILRDCKKAINSFDKAKTVSSGVDFRYLTYDYHIGRGYVSIVVEEFQISLYEDDIEYTTAVRVYNINSMTGKIMDRVDALVKFGSDHTTFRKAVESKLESYAKSVGGYIKDPQPYIDKNGKLCFVVELVLDGYSEWYRGKI